MHNPFDDGVIECDTAPWRGNSSHTQKVYLYPAFVPSSPPTPAPPLSTRGVSKQAENSRLWELGWMLRLLGTLFWANWRGNRNLAVVPISAAPAESSSCGSRRPPPPAPPAVRWKGRIGQWLRTQTLQLDDFFSFFLQLDD